VSALSSAPQRAHKVPKMASFSSASNKAKQKPKKRGLKPGFVPKMKGNYPESDGTPNSKKQHPRRPECS